ncbi:MAG: 6-carboxytetrahydropterin synthase [Gammaproteobacteria bacterium]
MATIFVERLVNLDFTYFDVKRGLVGETLLVDCTLSGAKNPEGMVLDFGHFKRLVSQTLEQSIDHKLVIPQQATDAHGHCVHTTPCPLYAGNTCLRLGNTADAIQLSLPDTGFCLVNTTTITPAHLEAHLMRVITTSDWWRPNWQAQIRLFPEPMKPNTPYFQYTHGLPKHTGACQRIAHGHRSRLSVTVDGREHAALTAFWCKRWQDIYLGSHLDRTSKTSASAYQFAYQSPEGHYSLRIPIQRTDLLQHETTIENIAQHIADQSVTLLAQQRFPLHPDAIPLSHMKTPHTATPIVVEARVYEGIQKGAIATAILTAYTGTDQSKTDDSENSAHTGQ